MTYDQFRDYGFVSRLSEVLQAKGASSNINQANAISQQQLGVASGAGSNAAADYTQFKDLIQPLITQQSALASGDRSAALSASMPVISKLSAGFTGAKQQIMNTLPPGAARDNALAGLTTQQDTTIGNTQAGLVQQAPQQLATVGAGLGQMSLQELGAQLSGLSGSAQTNMGAGQMSAAQQQSMVNMFMGLMQPGASLLSSSPWSSGGTPGSTSGKGNSTASTGDSTASTGDGTVSGGTYPLSDIFGTGGGGTGSGGTSVDSTVSYPGEITTSGTTGPSGPYGDNEW